MAISFGRYDDVVHGIYDAALHPARWPQAMAAIAATFGAPRALLFTHSHTPAQGGFTLTHNITQAALQLWATKSIREDPWVQSSGRQGLLAEGKVSLDSDLVAQEDLLRTNFYRDVLEPNSIAKVCSGIVFDATDARKLPTALSVYRGLGDAPFTRADAEVLHRLLAHLSRALGVMFHLRDKRLQMAASLEALNRLHGGVLLLDARGRVQFSNRHAEAMFRSGDIVTLAGGNTADPARLRLHARLASLQGALERAIALALQPPASEEAEHFSQAVVLPAFDGCPRCVVHAAPLASSSELAADGAKAIVFVYDLQQAAKVDPDALRALFGMTEAEARASVQMAQGGSIEEMAQRAGVSPNTFKTQLQAAYSKSGTHRQIDLLKLLLALASE